MKKVTVLTLGIIFLTMGLAFAQQAPSARQSTAQAAAQPVQVGNKICPVSGNPIGQMGPVIKHEYNGKIYNLCCPGCPGKFDQDPAKYAKIAEDEAAAK